MEEINQNQQIPQPPSPSNPPTPLKQSSEQSSKNWLIKYLLIGILGAIPFGIMMFILAMIVGVPISSVLSKYPGGGELIGEITVFVFTLVVPITSALFLIAMLCIGYRRSIPSGLRQSAPLPMIMSIIVFLFGASLGFLVSVVRLDVMSPVIKLGNIGDGLVMVFGLSAGAYLFEKIIYIFVGKITTFLFIRKSLVWLSLIFFIALISISQYVYALNKSQLQESTSNSKGCTKDSDCPAGLVCTGRGPAKPSVEIPGVCLSQKQSQVMQ